MGVLATCQQQQRVDGVCLVQMWRDLLDRTDDEKHGACDCVQGLQIPGVTVWKEMEEGTLFGGSSHQWAK